MEELSINHPSLNGHPLPFMRKQSTSERSQSNDSRSGSSSHRSTPSGISITASLHQICMAPAIIPLSSPSRHPALTLK
ncbi:hypothetical protein I7I53_03672 [Histoplasma capsulatum var. duboisii H88]|uniref:Uncharacterized protein n=1 Tax=Ajellomyces capsulatus (strain H88) TaxID=544711 RepID=A0A8A1LP39_AJEC8|nr:hypothetical protein I7I53_03672 [Histoplasma capsulatum var. duboisii H88]